ncbi:MAG: ABC transporter ATP-binding protein [Actinobacteria bacterium]|nr:MAG: ABC transporter ATP-binding protein [Actinomycetota bacterium]
MAGDGHARHRRARADTLLSWVAARRPRSDHGNHLGRTTTGDSVRRHAAHGRLRSHAPSVRPNDRRDSRRQCGEHRHAVRGAAGRVLGASRAGSRIPPNRVRPGRRGRGNPCDVLSGPGGEDRAADEPSLCRGSGRGSRAAGPRGVAVIRARRLARRFGDKRALEPVDFELARGGFLVVTGPNGSGKTTLLRLCAGLLIPTSGELEVDAERGQVGYLAHEPLVYRELTAIENLDLYGRLYRVPERRERIGMLLERFGLWEARAERTGSYSRGMLQRLALCRALLHDPELLILDEPANALDEAGEELLERELDELRRERTLLVASHAPERLERFATQRLALA